MRLELSLENLFNKIDSLEWKWDAYISIDAKLSESTPFLIIDDDSEEERDEPAYASSKGYEYFLTVSTLQDIKINLFAQKSNLKVCDFIRAVNYYYEYDAFVSINS
jgi:hypothetical protein